MGKEIQLIYLSDLLPGQEKGLTSILETSVRRNGEDGITGMLLYIGGNIMQVLEGEENAVRRTYERIGRDPRHRNIVLLTEETMTTRDFPDWRMGYKQVSEDVVQSVPGFAPFFQVDFRLGAIQAMPGVAREMLKFFACNR
jgi:hypothetical protein